MEGKDRCGRHPAGGQWAPERSFSLRTAGIVENERLVYVWTLKAGRRDPKAVRVVERLNAAFVPGPREAAG
jgi:hypothetical protein